MRKIVVQIRRGIVEIRDARDRDLRRIDALADEEVAVSRGGNAENVERDLYVPAR